MFKCPSCGDETEAGGTCGCGSPLEEKCEGCQEANSLCTCDSN